MPANYQLVPQGAPESFLHHEYRKTWTIPRPRREIWEWLNRPETFTEAQIPPYRVEFVSPSIDEPSGFHPGGLNIHHGPMLLASGQLGEIRPEEYRDLQYFYGSYVISLRLVRPTRLQFWLEQDGPEQTRVTMQIDALVISWFLPFWELGSRGFWGLFGFWMKKLNNYGLPS